MPKYKKEINRLVEPDEVRRMLARAQQLEHKILIVLLYVTGARPAELVNLRKHNLRVVGGDLQIELPTKKKGFDRILPFDLNDTPFLRDLLLPYLETLTNSQSPIFTFKTPTRIKQIVYELSEGELCPYNFRHNRLSRVAMAGGGVQELMNFKGARNMNSILPYLYKNPATLDRVKHNIQ